ncbi:hypothetical protein KSP39_PZI000450 [Platanthera zijinensis]|uniref:RRM domain-containing protein n=1 Tax=Platanthera zijinensis TaxID=2320716 RepID=A0AAP0C1W3_9ASPA
MAAAAAAVLGLISPACATAAAVKSQNFSLHPSSVNHNNKRSCFQISLRPSLLSLAFSLFPPRRRLLPSLSVSTAISEAYREEDNEEDVFGAREPRSDWKRERSSRSSSNDAGRLYVGNLPFSITSSELAEVFNQAGSVDAAEIVSDRATNRSRGFGFVTMASAKEANEAIQMFDGAQVGGRTLKVNCPEVPRGGEREAIRDRPRSISRGDNESPYKIYAGNLGWTVTSEVLMDVFSKCSGLLGAKVIYERDSGRSRGFGFINFASAEECQDALESMDGKMVSGRPIRLNLPSEKAPSREAPFAGSTADW